MKLYGDIYVFVSEPLGRLATVLLLLVVLLLLLLLLLVVVVVLVVVLLLLLLLLLFSFRVAIFPHQDALNHPFFDSSTVISLCHVKISKKTNRTSINQICPRKQNQFIVY